ncbi:Fic family protein, partial [Staphylococcus aureus]|nr:Fic family protein [Staphylococcus aureus]
GLEKAKFVERLAHYYCEINVLHPFRVGSGLAQRIFFEQLAIHAGYQLSWQGIEKEAWNQANQITFFLQILHQGIALFFDI